VNVVGSSLLSQASVGIRAASVSNAPFQPTKVSSTTTSVTITWQEPNYNGGNGITNYAVYVNDGVGGT
jgi:hypothetical protein